MSTPDLHPEELLSRERAGTLGAEQRATLDAHCARCAACALERRAARDFDAELGESAADDDVIARAIDGATRIGAGPIRRPSGAGRDRWILLAAAALLATAAAAAGVWRSRKAPPAEPDRAAEPAAHPVVAARQPARAAEPGPSAEPTAEPAASAPAPSAAPIGSAGRAPTAAELFASANQARRAHQDAEAIRLYRELQRRHPESREAQASRVMLGQLLLDTTEPDQALQQFDSYGEKGQKAPVAEEALVGRAQALQKLGRKSEERAAWQELLAKFPTSVHAARARARLKELKE